MIAATTRKVGDDLCAGGVRFHPPAVAICTDIAERNAGRVKVFEQKARGHLDARGSAARCWSGRSSSRRRRWSRWRRRPMWPTISAARKPNWRGRFRRGAPPFAPAATAAIVRRLRCWSGANTKRPSSVIMLEALSQLLPDHTYVTELHLAGSKLQIVGITRDAPSLIPLIEQSKHFTRATFYAPTTRAPSDPGERFHIETRVEPKNTVCDELGNLSPAAARNPPWRASLAHSPLIAVVLTLACRRTVADMLAFDRASPARAGADADLLDQLQGRRRARRVQRRQRGAPARRSWRGRR